MPDSNFIKYHVFIAGLLVKTGAVVIATGVNNLCSCRVSIDYSPHIIHLPKYSQISVFSSINDSEPTLEFDGVIVGINYSKSIMTGHSVTLSCFTQGIVWNARRQIDLTLQELLGSVVKAGSTDLYFSGVGGGIDSNYANFIKTNGYDIGAAGTCVLTSHFIYNTSAKNSDGSQDTNPTSYLFVYNGKLLKSEFDTVPENDTTGFTNPTFYLRFLDTLRLSNKVYGLSTTATLTKYFQQDRFLEAIASNTYTDIHGENTFWQIAANTWNIAFHEVIDVPNATFIPYDNNTSTQTTLNISEFKVSSFDSDGENTKTISQFTTDSFKKISVINNKNQFAGLAEYVIKPRSIFGIPFKCNVIWPDQVIEFSFLKDYLNEVTRMRCIRNGIPGVSDSNLRLSTSVILGPNFNDKDNYFNSFNVSTINADDDTRPRTQHDYSTYEDQFGAVQADIQLMEAYNATLYGDADDDKSKLEESNRRLKIYTNHEFAQRYFINRPCSITVNNEVDVVAGMPIVILNESGQHIIAYCASKEKSWQANGSMSVRLEVHSARYVSELIGNLAQVVDPLSYESLKNNDQQGELNNTVKELEKLLGSERIDVLFGDTNTIETAVNDTFKRYNYYKDSNLIDLKSLYKRKVCTYTEYCNFYENKPLQFKSNQYVKPTPISIEQNMSAQLQDIFNSTPGMDSLSCNRYTVYDTINNTLETISGKSVNEIVNLHIAFTNNSANRV